MVSRMKWSVSSSQTPAECDLGEIAHCSMDSNTASPQTVLAVIHLLNNMTVNVVDFEELRRAIDFFLYRHCVLHANGAV